MSQKLSSGCVKLLRGRYRFMTVARPRIFNPTAARAFRRNRGHLTARVADTLLLIDTIKFRMNTRVSLSPTVKLISVVAVCCDKTPTRSSLSTGHVVFDIYSVTGFVSVDTVLIYKK